MLPRLIGRGTPPPESVLETLAQGQEIMRPNDTDRGSRRRVKSGVNG